MTPQALGHGLDGIARKAAAGLSDLPHAFTLRHWIFILAAQRPDGGFAGRRGASDLYYTSFALRCAEALRAGDDAFWRAAARYADTLSTPPRDLVECFCLAEIERLLAVRAGRRRGGRRAQVLDVLARCRATTGGYALHPGGDAAVYHTFLAALCATTYDFGEPDAESVSAFVSSRQSADGGFSDSAPEAAAAGRTNATAAAATLLGMMGALDEAAASRAAGFLASMQRPDGGFAASASAPAPDLLSTFTALAALAEMRALARARLAPAARFVRAMELPAGGFRGSADDDSPDVEYAYYGLGSLGLLAWAARAARRPGTREWERN